ncbi:MAG TPA: amidohydrolase [Candidatus Aminicenantes bacterium]|nr:amidohydrolase [Candidatus Aminicenantes bacterium]
MRSIVTCVLPTVLLILLAAAPLRPAPPPESGLEKKLKAMTEKLTSELIDIRRDIHAHPELGNHLPRTSAIVIDYFRKLGIDVRTGYADSGVVAVLRGGQPGPVVAVRGDMDALPITEETGLPFASKDTAVVDGRETGLMHACGHDIHTTMLLGVAAVLASVRDELPGTVVFIAQPGEECCDGARLMIADGAFKDVVPEAFFAYHVDDTLKAGRLGYTSGFMSANVDGFTLEIKSEGCHGASPWSCVDPIVVGAEIVTALQVLVARELSVHNNTVITVGSFHSGSAPNIIPESARLEATVRNYGEDQRRLLQDKITRTITNICEAAGAEFDLAYAFGTSSVYNDPALVREALATAERVLGSKAALVEQKPEMGGEDFSAFGTVAPAVMFNLGVVPPDLEATAVHSPTFLADEAAIPIGVNLMANILLDHQLRRAGPAEKKRS